MGGAAVPRLVADEEGPTEGRQAPAEVGGQGGACSHGRSPAPLAPAQLSRISQEIMNGMTGQANAWGRPAIGCPETGLLSCEKVRKEKSPQDTRPTWGKFPTRTRSVSMPQLVVGVGRRLYPSV